MPEAKMCCCNSSQPRLCKSGCWQPAVPQQSQCLFTFFIGWVLLLRGCSKVCRPHLTAVRQSCSLATFIWEGNGNQPCFPWDHGGTFNASVADAVSSAIISTWQLHVTTSAEDEVQHSMWKGLSGQMVVTERHISSSGGKILQFSIYCRKEDEWETKSTRSPAHLGCTGLQGVLQSTFCKIPLW